MPSYSQYKRQLAVLDADDSDIEAWITVKGNHIPIKKGQSKEEAVKSFVERKRGVANEVVNRIHGHAIGAWIGASKEHKDLFYRKENNETVSNKGMHEFVEKVENAANAAYKTDKFKDSVMSAHSIAMGDLQKQMPESLKKTFTPERHKELMEKKFKDKDEDVVFGNWHYSDQYKNEFFNDEGHWLDNEAEKRYDFMRSVEEKFDDIYEQRKLEAMQRAVKNLENEFNLEKPKNNGKSTFYKNVSGKQIYNKPNISTAKKGYTVIENQLLTEKEMKKHGFDPTSSAFEKRELGKNDHRYEMGARFETPKNKMSKPSDKEMSGSSINNIFQQANAGLQSFVDDTGYQPQTTFWQDFGIAEPFGEKAIEDTYNRAFREWKNDKVYLTELSMMLNWKIWQHYDRGNEKVARLYDKLWKQTDKYAHTHLKGDDLQYYIRTTD